MGLDLLVKATPPFQKAFREGAAYLDGPNLFSGAPTFKVSVTANPFEPHQFVKGQICIVRLDTDRLLVQAGITAVGMVPDPPPSVLATISCSGGVAVGTVVRVFRSSGLAEITLE